MTSLTEVHGARSQFRAGPSRSTTFFLQCTGSTDADCDRINDDLEHELCSRAAFSDVLIPTTEELGHECRNFDDYRAPTMTILVPTSVEAGPDSDGDGVLRLVDVEMSTPVFDRRNPTNPVSFEDEPSSTFFLDDLQGVGDDQDAQTDGTPWTIVMMHHAPYSWGDHGNDWAVHVNWNPLFERYNADVVITAHDHLYCRTYPVIAREAQANGTAYNQGVGPVYVVLGGGG